MLSGMLILASQPIQAAIVFSDDFEAGAVNTFTPAVDGQWTTPSLSGWTSGGTLDVSGTDFYSFSGSTYVAPHSGHITAAFFSAGNSSDPNTASIERTIATSTAPGFTYDIHFWISNPITNTSARQNLFSVTWGNTVLNLSSYDPLFKTPDILLNELQGGPNEYVLAPNTNWFEVTLTGLTATSANTVLRFTGQNNNSATLVDDITVVETPEPTTIALLGAGAVLVGMRRKRRALS